jgi:hypothetical protein
MSPRWNWDSPTPLAASECALPPIPKGGGAPIPTTGETLSTLPTVLCGREARREEGEGFRKESTGCCVDSPPYLYTPQRQVEII